MNVKLIARTPKTYEKNCLAKATIKKITKQRTAKVKTKLFPDATVTKEEAAKLGELSINAWERSFVPSS